MSSKEEIVSKWRHFGWENRLSMALGNMVRLDEDQIECLKIHEKIQVFGSWS